MRNNQTEPAAAMRQMASMLWQIFVALAAEGFSEQQALTIIGQVISANQNPPD